MASHDSHSQSHRAQSQPPRPRPLSPTELSYTQLAKLAPPSSRGRRVDGDDNNSNNNDDDCAPPLDAWARRRGGPSASTTTTTMTPVPSSSWLASSSSAPPAPRTAPPSFVGAPPMKRVVDAEATKTTTATTAASSSAPPPRRATRPEDGSSRVDARIRVSTSTPTGEEDRVSRLASTLLRSGPTPTPMPPSSAAAGIRFDLPATTEAPTDRPGEIRQFIETLRGMQAAVMHTSDERQRARKSRALNALLDMFERIALERGTATAEVPAAEDPAAAEDAAALLWQRRLRDENMELSALCREKDGRLGELADEVRRARAECRRLAGENDRLRAEHARAREDRAREAERAREAAEAARAAEGSRDGLLSDFARLTEENVALRREEEARRGEDDGIVAELEACREELARLRNDRDRSGEELRRRASEVAELRRAGADARTEGDRTAAELEACRGEAAHLRDSLDASSEELGRKASELADAEGRMDDLHDRLVSERNSLREANEDRRQLRDELRASQRNSTSASEQLMHLREQFSAFRRDGADRDDGARAIRARDGRRRPAESVGTTTTSRSSTDRVGGDEDLTLRDGLRSMRCVDDDLKARVYELNAWLDGSIGPRSRKSAMDSISINRGTDGARGDLFNGDDASLVSHRTSSQHEGSNGGAARGGVSDTRNGPSSSSIGPRSRKTSVMDEFSLDGMDNIINDEVGDGILSWNKSRNRGPKEENAQPILMDYFYSQIKLAE